MHCQVCPTGSVLNHLARTLHTKHVKQKIDHRYQLLPWHHRGAWSRIGWEDSLWASTAYPLEGPEKSTTRVKDFISSLDNTQITKVEGPPQVIFCTEALVQAPRTHLPINEWHHYENNTARDNQTFERCLWRIIVAVSQAKERRLVSLQTGTSSMLSGIQSYKQGQNTIFDMLQQLKGVVIPTFLQMNMIKLLQYYTTCDLAKQYIQMTVILF